MTTSSFQDVHILIGEGVRETDKDLFFGPLSGEEEWTYLDPSSSKEDVAVRFGLFSSKGQARKNGWGGPIPDGYTEIKRVGKFRRSFYFLKILAPIPDVE